MVSIRSAGTVAPLPRRRLQLAGSRLRDVGQKVEIVHQRRVDDRHRAALEPVKRAGDGLAHQQQIGADRGPNLGRRGVERLCHLVERRADLGRCRLEPPQVERAHLAGPPPAERQRCQARP